MKFLELNINQRSRENAIPEVVTAEIARLEPDVFVLNECLSGSSEERRKLIQGFTDPLSDEYYFFYNVERAGRNGILIAVKKKIEGKYNTVIIREVEKMDTTNTEQPNFLQIDMEANGKPLTIIGTRLRGGEKIENYREGCLDRRKELAALIDHIDSLDSENIIVAGDFNHGVIRGDESKFYHGADGVREGYHFTSKGEVNDLYDTHNYHLMKEDFRTMGMAVHTPSGKQFSYGFQPVNDKDRTPDNGFFKIDHFVTTNSLKVQNLKYCHQFMETHREDLKWKKDERGKWFINPPFPDHAILTADISFLD